MHFITSMNSREDESEEKLSNLIWRSQSVSSTAGRFCNSSLTAGSVCHITNGASSLRRTEHQVICGK
jgi:hypothetical protein